MVTPPSLPRFALYHISHRARISISTVPVVIFLMCLVLCNARIEKKSSVIDLYSFNTITLYTNIYFQIYSNLSCKLCHVPPWLWTTQWASKQSQFYTLFVFFPVNQVHI